MPGLIIEILGPLRLRVDGEIAEIPSRRQRAVLAQLVADVGRPVATDTLVDAAWGVEPAAHPAAALQTVVSRLRSALSPGARVEHGPAGYTLLLDDAELDAQRFERLVAQADTQGAERARDLLDQALTLWRGAAFGGIDVPAVLVRADQLAEARTAATVQLGRILIETGEPDRAIELLREVVRAHPLREDLAAELIDAMRSAGRPAQALATFHHTRELLARELGIDPSARLEELHRRILTDDRQQHGIVGSGPARPDAESGLVTWALATAADAVPAARRAGDRAVLDHIGLHAPTLVHALRIARRRTDGRADLLSGQLALITSHRLDPSLAIALRELPDPETADARPHGALALAGAGRAATLMGDPRAGLSLSTRAWRAAGTDDPETAYLAAHTLAIANVYLGDRSSATRWCRRQLAADDVVAHHADAHATLALIATYAGDSSAAEREAAHARRLADRSGAEGYRAFATYAAGEVALGSSRPERADRLLQEAVRLAVDAGAHVVRGLADTARGSFLVRSGRLQEAAVLLRDALVLWRGVDAWAQVWTTARLLGEVCAALGDPESALLLLVVADRSPTAPAVTGADAERQLRLRLQLERAIGGDGVARVVELARAMPADAVLDRAARATRPQ